jgi:hypothetical protein
MNRWRRLAPFTGVVYFILVLVTFFASSSTPNSDATGQHVISFYEAHKGNVRTTSIVGVVAALFLLFFAAELRSYLRARSAGEGLTTLGFGGAVTLAVGLSILESLTFALADVPSKLGPEAAQALNVAANDLFFPFLLGSAAFLLGNGLAIVASVALPRWLGWVGFALGLVSLTPVGWFAFVLGTLWVAVIGVLIAMRARRPVDPAVAGPAPSVEREPVSV